MDPFSIIIGGVSLLELTFKVTKYMRDVNEAAGSIEGELSSLISEIQGLDSVNKSIKHLHEAEVESLGAGYADLPVRDQELWHNTASNLRDCQKTVERLQIVLEAVTGKSGEKVTGWRDGVKKQLRKQSKDGELNSIRSQISLNRQSLHISLTMLDLIYTKRGSDTIQKLGFQLQRQIASLQSRLPLSDRDISETSLGCATDIAASLHLNEHFDTPKTVSSIFTGRQIYLNGLKQAFDLSLTSSETGSTQKRFVVFGLGGSGKTQFCCKFASDNKQRFWGVFTVDASSQETARQSFIAIAKICGVDPNERAAKSWLSSVDRPWLLLVDNADDTKLEVERYLPDGDNGLTIITTRNPNIKMLGTIGKRFYQFDRLEDAEASQLLLRAAEHHEPPTAPVLRWTSTITQALGGLPLALVHAGNAIKAKYCGLSDYLIYYEQSWQIIRQDQRLNKSPVGNDSNMDEYIQVYSSYEILYRGLEAMDHQRFKDALQLLQLFAFFHHENIPFDILIAAVRHPKLERDAQNESKDPDSSQEEDFKLTGVRRAASWLRDLVMGALERYFANQGQTVLPTFLRDAEHSHPPDGFNVRLRRALHELARLSLITYHESSDSYSMHPLVHTWVRERPQMTTRKQAVWCEAALTTISRCILLPPLSDFVASHIDLPRKLLPHLLAVEKRQEKIQADFLYNQKDAWRPWPPVLKSSEIYPKKALQMARASLVYVQCGYFDEAEKRQRIVRDFVYKMRGPDHPIAMDITLALAVTLWLQSRSNESADLQDQVLQGCLRSLGPNHPRTLKVMDALGESRRQQGRLKESIELHEQAIAGMTAHLPEDDPALFHARDHFGVTLWYCLRFEEAVEHQEAAVAGLKRLLGEADLKTLLAIEALSRTYQRLGVKYLESNPGLSNYYLKMADRNMTFVVEERTKQLGSKQPYTWLAKVHLGAIKGAMGELDEGERLIASLIPMAVAHLGADHLGVMAGKNELARILIKQKRFSEAEDILLDISSPEKYQKTATATGDHPDRIDALWTLLECYHQQDKIDDGLQTCDVVEGIILRIRKGKKDPEISSPFWDIIQERKRDLQAAKDDRDRETLSFSGGSTTEDLRSPAFPRGIRAITTDAQPLMSSGELRQRPPDYNS